MITQPPRIEDERERTESRRIPSEASNLHSAYHPQSIYVCLPYGILLFRRAFRTGAARATMKDRVSRRIVVKRNSLNWNSLSIPFFAQLLVHRQIR